MSQRISSFWTLNTHNVTSITEVQSASLFSSMWRPPVSVITTLYYVAIIFHRRVWHHAHSLHFACIRRSGIILAPWATFVPNFVSFAASTVELAHGENSILISIAHPAYLMTQEPKHLCFGIFAKTVLYLHTTKCCAINRTDFMILVKTLNCNEMQ